MTFPGTIIRTGLILLTVTFANPLRASEALFEAIQFADLSAVQSLLAGGADPNHSENNRPMLAWAAQAGNIPIAKALIDAGAELEAVDGVGHTALLRAVDVLDTDMAIALIEAGANAGAAMPDGRTVSMLAAENGQVDIMRALIKSEASFDGVDVAGNTAAMLVVQNQPDNVETVIALLGKAGSDLNRGNLAYTPLTYAVEQGDAAIVQALLKAGADANARNPYDQTPIEVAQSYENEAMVELLTAAGATVAAPPESEVVNDSGTAGTSDDLQSLPRLESVATMSGFGGGVSYFSGASVARLVEFYRTVLDAQGWEPTQELTDNENYASFTFKRGTETLTFSLGLSTDSDPPKVMVSLVPVGSLSTATLPRYPGVEAIYESEATSIYVSADPVPTVGEETGRLLRADGWDGKVIATNDTSHITEWTRDGSKLSVFISVAPAQDNKTSIQYSLSLGG